MIPERDLAIVDTRENVVAGFNPVCARVGINGPFLVHTPLTCALIKVVLATAAPAHKIKVA